MSLTGMVNVGKGAVVVGFAAESARLRLGRIAALAS